MATGAAIGALLAGTAGAVSTGASLVQSNRAKHTAEREYKQQQVQLKQQEQQALNKRKQQIDDLRYNLLGNNSSSSVNKIKNNNTSLVNNDITLG